VPIRSLAKTGLATVLEKQALLVAGDGAGRNLLKQARDHHLDVYSPGNCSAIMKFLEFVLAEEGGAGRGAFVRVAERVAAGHPTVSRHATQKAVDREWRKRRSVWRSGSCRRSGKND
jgi:hypothetical protein